jgi:CheY-like chemotaxis protein
MNRFPTILLVDDELAAMSYYVRFLEMRGFRLEQRSSVSDAIRFLTDTRPHIDAVVLDLMLPQAAGAAILPAGGLEVFELLRKKFARVPVVVLTNTVDSNILAQFQTVGRTRVLHKYNCPPSLLGEILREVIRPDNAICARFGKRTVVVQPAPTVGELMRIPRGEKGATMFHDWVFRGLKYVFGDRLGDGTKERPIDRGRKRIDIAFQNVATSGFFFDLLTRYQVRCPWILVECKNYSADPGNPEFDQLVGRFSRNRGEFGLLACREVLDDKLMLERCLDVANKDRGFVLVLDDKALGVLLKARAQNDLHAVNTFMHERFANLVL